MGRIIDLIGGNPCFVSFLTRRYIPLHLHDLPVLGMRVSVNVVCVFSAIGEPVRLEWFNPQGERITSSPRVALHTEGVRSRLTVYNAIVEDAGIYRCQATDARGQTQEATVVLEIYREMDTNTHTFTHTRNHSHIRQEITLIEPQPMCIHLHTQADHSNTA